ncbi:glycerophosphodiester phosphodiesterase [Actinomycetospora endophytica]|uniref:Glycerophosphodiester phosphodiesterase n=1 Tax=Actinomycetospora endophytica TaxID=2291215 RepID=A0ABS8P9K3_9PSEU|nr:glycerophosphodiester phosphodiesterase family protein [Actinomycetospora endophytica]MCD2194946.1 glycerophosphodiester phosphodiesterase [Actinomycetospora endophytica]
MWGSLTVSGISWSRDGRGVDTRATPPSGTLRPVIPVARSHPYLAASRPRAFAHRGWHVGDLAGLENTLAAFRRARDEGYSYVETDVHATRDGVLVVHHDATLRRVAGHPGVLRAMEWADVAPVRVRGREKLPRLEEALEALPGMRFNVDLKSPGALRPMLELLERDDVAERVAVASTDEGRLRAVRQRFGDRVVTGVSARAALSLRTRSVLPRAISRHVPVGGDLAQLPVRFGGLPVVDATSLRAAHAAGLEVHVWTVDRASEMHRLLDLGVDGLMTDRPDLLRDVLAVRGAWEAAPPAV